MANTHKLIKHTTVGSGGVATITFTSIPQTYTDLKLFISLRSTRVAQNNDDVFVDFNASTADQVTKYIQSDGSGIGSFTDTRMGVLIPGSTATALIWGIGEMYIPNYTVAVNKASMMDAFMENNTTQSYGRVSGFNWNQTTAITEIKLTCADGLFVEYSSATLYGIKNT